MTECVHGMEDPAWCTICNGKDEKQKLVEEEVLYTFAAKFQSVCRCGNAIEVGNKIAKLGSGRYVCEDCADL